MKKQNLVALLVTISTQALLPFSAHAFVIAGGEEVKTEDPISTMSVAVVQRKGDSDVGICGGTLISGDSVLTAAHCLSGDKAPVVIFSKSYELSESDLNNKGITAQSRTIPKSYSEIKGKVSPYDIAVIRLSKNAPSNYQPAPLIDVKDEFAPGTMITLASYGGTDIKEIDQSSTETLRKISQPLTDILKGPNTQKVLREQQNGVRPGDSGGSAYVDQNGHLSLFGVILAVGSFTADGQTQYSNTVLRLNSSEIREWLNDAIRRLNDHPEIESTLPAGSITVKY